MLTTYNKGIWSEYLACLYLFLLGYKILETRYKTKFGEIDIIATKKKYVHFFEVKYRSSEEKAKLAITPKNQSRVINASKIFLQLNNKYYDYLLSFDAITVNLPLRIKIIYNAWS